MKHILRCSASKRAFIPCLLIAFFIGLTSCDDPGLVNFRTERSDFHYNLNSSDTLAVFLQTIKEDSVRSERFSRDILGSYFDQTFGKTNASIYTEIRLPKKIVSYGTTRFFDSLVLELKYSNTNNSFGWLDDEMTFEVYELDQRIYLDTPYYSTSKIKYKPIPVGSWTGKLKPNGKSVIRIHLNSIIGNKILNGTNQQLGDDTKFKEIIKGLAIIPKNTISTGVLVTLNLQNDTSGLSLYFHNEKDTLVSKFQINDKCARINNFSHDYSISNAYNQIVNPQLTYSQVYLQPLAGFKVQLSIPDLKSFASLGPIAINKAELIFHPQVTYPYSNYTIPTLILLLTDTSNTNFSMMDRFEDYYGGTYDKIENTYSFVVTRYIQNLINQFYKSQDFVSKYKLNLIIPSDNPILSTPLILQNLNNSGKTSTELKLYFTKLK